MRISLRAVPEREPVLVRMFREVGGPHLWSLEAWSTYGSAPAKRHWVIQVDGEPAGLLTLLELPEGEAEVVTFGLIPDYQGQGLGGYALTLAVDLAWTTFDGISRVWLHTNNFDHPSALPNYQKRGFVIADRTVHVVTVPDDWGPPSSR